MEAITEYRGNKRFEISARGHRVICHQTRESHGEDAGIAPPELMRHQLGCCACARSPRTKIGPAFYWRSKLA